MMKAGLESYFKAVRSVEDIDSSDVDERVKLSAMVLFQEAHNGHNTFRVDHHLELVVRGHLNGLDILWQALSDVLAQIDQTKLLILIGLLDCGRWWDDLCARW